MRSKIFNFIIIFVITKQIEGKPDSIEKLFQSHLHIGIINGNEAKPNQFPHHIGISAWYEELFASSTCSGSLISNKTILTSGNCLYFHFLGKIYYPDSVKIYYGCHKVPCINQTVVLNNSVIVHPNADIGVVNLDTPLKIGDAVKPIALDFDTKDHVNDKATLTGWGYTKDGDYIDPNRGLRFVDLKVISNDECAKKFKNITKNQICTGATNDKGQHVGFCYGDNGGALISSGKQIGIASIRSENCNDPTFPSGFTRVSEFKDWIEKNSQI